MTRRPLTHARTDARLTGRRTGPARALGTLAATLAALLAAAWLATQPLAALTALAGLALATHAAWRLRNLATRYRPTPLRRLTDLAGR